jgi:hypothetical protein
MATVKKLPTTNKKKSKDVEAVAIKLPEATQKPDQGPSWYPIDWETVKTVEDIKAILEHMGLGCSTDAPAYDKLKKYLFQNYIKVR